MPDGYIEVRSGGRNSGRGNEGREGSNYRTRKE